MTITVGTTHIIIREISLLPGEKRRDAEQRTVATILADRLGEDAVIAHRPDGSPYIAGRDIYISVSHSRELAAVALDQCRPLGIDIEEERAGQLARVASRYLTAAELELHSNDLLRAWTRKEARYKYLSAAAHATGTHLPPSDLRAIAIDDRHFALDCAIGTHRLVLATA